MIDSPIKKELHFWSESFFIGEAECDIVAGTTEQGLCWLSLGQKKDEQTLMEKWAARWLPDYSVVSGYERNRTVFSQISKYLEGKLENFNLSLHQKGTPFQIKVWQELLKIPYGVTCSYADIADRIGCPKGQRAVGLANNKNPISIIVPCHRVIGKNGGLVGYGGGLRLKKELLDLEQKFQKRLSY